jgi:cold shock CspA family protein
MMKIPLELTFRDVLKTETIENLIRKKVEKLHKICDSMTSCTIAVEQPQKEMKQGSPYRVRIQCNVPPGYNIIAKREPGQGDMHDDISAVIRDTFQTAERELKKLQQQQRDEIKTHPMQETQAMVNKLFRGQGYGFLRTIDNREIYFHKNSVLHGDFERLEIGTGVRFIESLGDKGPQATTVQIVDKPGSRVSLEK